MAERASDHGIEIPSKPLNMGNIFDRITLDVSPRADNHTIAGNQKLLLETAALVDTYCRAIHSLTALALHESEPRATQVRDRMSGLIQPVLDGPIPDAVTTALWQEPDELGLYPSLRIMREQTQASLLVMIVQAMGTAQALPKGRFEHFETGPKIFNSADTRLLTVEELPLVANALSITRLATDNSDIENVDLATASAETHRTVLANQPLTKLSLGFDTAALVGPNVIGIVSTA